MTIRIENAMMVQHMKVRKNVPVARDHYRMTLECETPYETVHPGQFVMVRIPGAEELLLRRPFSICRTVMRGHQCTGIELLYRVVGKGTARLARIREGDQLDVLGPLGKGFVVLDDIESVYVVAGGIGIAPMIFLLSELENTRLEPKHITVFTGAKSADEVLCRAEMEILAGKGGVWKMTTDDGSAGEKGLVTDLLEKSLEKNRPDIVYACGPVAMLKKVAALVEGSGISCQISMESLMACGMGACLGCAIANSKRPESYDHVCMDGPVFDLDRFGF